MKKTFFLLAVCCATLFTKKTSAQAFEKGSTYLTVGIGGAHYRHLGHLYYSGYRWAPVTAELNVQAEWGVHEYVGVGLFTGVGGASYPRWGEFNIPLGLVVNFHFWQLMADKGTNLAADKVDVYVGANLGSGLGVWYGSGSYTGANALLWGGLQIGARYFFKENIAVNGELGYGKTFANLGITFKL